MSERLMLVGAHLRAADAAVDGVTSIDASPLTLSAVAFPASLHSSDRKLIGRTLEARQKLIEREIFVAIRYGAAADTPDQARQLALPFVARWNELLERHRGKIELTLKLAPRERPTRPRRQDAASGRDYLEQLQRMRAEALSSGERETIERRFAEFEKRWCQRSDGGSELALLTSRTDLERVRKAGEALRQELPDLPFVLSGPWPLEVFAND
jgi:hypothetical protein